MPVLILALLGVSFAIDAWAPSLADGSVLVQEAYIETPDGVRLYYRIAGEGNETVIVPFALFHGSTLDPLAKRRRIVTYDPRGRGKSDAVPPERVTLDLLLSDLDTVRTAVGAKEIAIIGWSGGGMETFVYSLRNPGKVTRHVQLAPVAARFVPYSAMMMEDRRSRTDTVLMAELQDQFNAGDFEGRPAELCRAFHALHDPPMFADPENLPNIPDICVHENEHPANIREYFGALMASIDGYDYRSQLNDITVPRLVIHGERDNIPLAGNEEWVRGVPHARILVVKDAGHWPTYERPQATLSAIETFLSGEWPAKAREIP